MDSNKKTNIKVKIFQYASLISISIITGILIALFQVGLKYLFKGIYQIYESSIETVTPLVIYTSICTVVLFAFYILVRYLKLNLNRGTQVLTRYLSSEKVKIYEYPLLVFGFAISLFAGLPVGAVEVCQCVSVGIASEVYKRTDIKDNDSFDSVASASFGAAFMSPLAGFFYGLESRKWKVTWPCIVKMFLAVVVTMGFSYLTLMIFKMQKIQILYQPQQETLFSNRSIYNGEQVEQAEVVEPSQIEGTTDESVEEKPVIDPYDTEEKEVTDDDEIPDFLKGEDDIKIIE